MSDKTSSVRHGKPPLLGAPGSALRWLLPMMICAGVLALALLVVVVRPMSAAASAEPDPAIQAVLADNVFLLQVRLWTILLTAVLMGGALAVAGAQQDRKALTRLELRLRRIADGETELPPTVPAKDHAQFDEVFLSLRAALERVSRRNLPVLQKAEHSLRVLSQQLAAGKATPEETRKSVSDIWRELDVALDAERRASATRAKMAQGVGA